MPYDRPAALSGFRSIFVGDVRRLVVPNRVPQESSPRIGGPAGATGAWHDSFLRSDYQPVISCLDHYRHAGRLDCWRGEPRFGIWMYREYPHWLNRLDSRRMDLFEAGHFRRWISLQSGGRYRRRRRFGCFRSSSFRWPCLSAPGNSPHHFKSFILSRRLPIWCARLAKNHALAVDTRAYVITSAGWGDIRLVCAAVASW